MAGTRQMKQQQFIEQQRPLWEQFRQLLEQLEQPRNKNKIADPSLLPALYRRLCADYALAHHRRYSTPLVDELHALVQRGHRLLYQRKSLWLWRAMLFFWEGFPNALRRHSRAFWLAAAMLYLPALVMGITCYEDGDFIYSVYDSQEVASYEYMYDPANETIGRQEERASDSNIAMFGYYIEHNISIGFRAFAGGMFVGIGTVVAMLFNGVAIGSVAGHVSQLGFTGTFWPFVAGHSAFELTAICISGAAGLLLAYALVAPGRRTRSEALQLAAREAVTLMIGATLFLVAAAFIEAFWSSSRAIEPSVKYIVSALLWSVVILYLGFAGRQRRAT